jgi:uncharacterized protein (UPF0332 family)
MEKWNEASFSGSQEMNPEFQECLKKHKIKRFSRGKALVSKEMKTAKSDFEQAGASFEKSSYKWAMIQSYYAMFHAARALLYAKSYRERSHYCLIVAIKALYTDKGLVPNDLLEALRRGKTLRENADYYDHWSQTAAQQMLESAKVFIKMARKLIRS